MSSPSNEVVLSLDDASRRLEGTYPGEYLAKYLREIGCKQAVLEKDYVDKDFLIDFANYYSRSFEDIPRHVERIHFFDMEFSEDEFLRAVDDNKVSETAGRYLGFCVIKPMKVSTPGPLIGRTLLSPYPECSKDGSIHRVYLASEFKSHLFGNELRIDSIPFQSQDQQTCACATVVLYSACHALSSEYGTRTLSPSEITARATSSLPMSRCFPSMGLTLEQMISYIRTLDMEVDILTVCPLDLVLENDWPEEVEEAVRLNVIDSKLAIQAYVQAKFPIIATLVLVKYNEKQRIIRKEHHAVLISGFGETPDGTLTELYIHDDGIGPYCKASWNDNLPTIDYEWNDPKMDGKFGIVYDKIFLGDLIVPVYPKFRLPSHRIIPYYSRYREMIKSQGLDSRLMFYRASDYKSQLIKEKCPTRRSILMRNMPRFIAVVRIYADGEAKEDLVYDATAAYIGLEPDVIVKHQPVRM